MVEVMSANQNEAGQKHRKINPKSLANLRPAWEPGISANPAGLPKGTPRLSTAYQKILNSPAKGKFKPETRGDKIALAIVEQAEDGDVKAAKEIADRIEGKAPQTITQTTTNLELKITTTVEQLLAIARQRNIPLDEERARVLVEAIAGVKGEGVK